MKHPQAYQAMYALQILHVPSQSGDPLSNYFLVTTQLIMVMLTGNMDSLLLFPEFIRIFTPR